MSEKVPYANGHAVAELRGLPSQKLTLEVASNVPANWKSIEWAPKDGTVHDLELRAEITSARGTIGSVIKTLYKLELGAGDGGNAMPPAAPPNGSGTIIVPYWMPDRGMVLRLNARRAKAFFRAEVVSGGPVSQLELQASFQPTSTGSEPSRIPKMTTGLAAERIAVPSYATRWRFRDPATGAALAAGSLTGLGIFAGPVGPVLLSSLADFTPISAFIQSYTASVPHLVEFE